VKASRRQAYGWLAQSRRGATGENGEAEVGEHGWDSFSFS